MIHSLEYDCDEEWHRERIDRRRDRESVRRRVYCLGCKKKIPETKRVVAKFCSTECKNRHNWGKIKILAVEIRHTIREMKTVGECTECGDKLDTKVRPGPVPTMCNTCRWRAAKRKYRASKKCQ